VGVSTRLPSPEPPAELPAAVTVHVPGRGEFFLRDSGGEGPVVLLLHGWMVTADLNWIGAYAELAAAGYRVLAIDHRGHGRGLRGLVPFRLSDCAADAAGVLRTLDLAPAIVVGYSMGGAIAQLMTREQPDAVAGVVLSGTAQHWQEPALRRYWRSMGLVGLALSLFPSQFWRRGFRRTGLADGREAAWIQSEMLRHYPADIAEAGRELGRFDSRPWLRRLDVPSAVVLTSRDEAVPPHKQRQLAEALEAPVFEAPVDHLEIVRRAGDYNPALLQALASVRDHPELSIVQGEAEN
jgi:pimeloyl-ACP methyl ester carboxylesterase